MDGDKRILNFRTFLFAAVFSVAAVLTCYLYFVNVGLTVFAVLLEISLLIFLFLHYRKCNWKLIGMSVVLCVYVLTMIACAIFLKNNSEYVLTNRFGSKSFELTGKIININDDGLNKSLLIEPILKDEKADGNVLVYIDESFKDEACLDDVECNDLFKCVVSVSPVTIPSKDYKINGNYYRLDVRYICYVTWQNVTIEKNTEFDMFVKIRNSIERCLVESLGEKYGQVAYGMLIGDKSFIDFGTKNYYRVSGIGHILAVSGLHVMFLSMLIMRMCKTLRLKKRSSFVVMTVVLLIYNIVVGFTPSIIRATVMSLCLNVSSLLGERNDMLNNLGLACSLILMCKPFYLFDAGFVLSMAAVFGIALFCKPISTFLIGKLPKIFHGIVKAFAVSFSAQIGTLPASICYFNQISVFSIFVNVLTSYVVMITFVWLFCSVAITLIMPFMSFLIKPAKIGLVALDFCTRTVSNIPVASIAVYAGVGVFTLYIAYFVMSRFLMKRRLKPIIVLVCVVYCFTAVFAYNIRFQDISLRVYFIDDFQTHSLLIDENSDVFFIGEYPSVSRETDILEKLKIAEIKEMYMFKSDFKTVKAVISLSQKVKVGTVYFAGKNDLECLELLEKADIDYRYLSSGGKKIGVVKTLDVFGTVCFTYEYKGEKILFANPEAQLYEEDPTISSFSVIRSRRYDKSLSRFKTLCNYAGQGENDDNCLSLTEKAAYYDIKTGKFEKNI